MICALIIALSLLIFGCGLALGLALSPRFWKWALHEAERVAAPTNEDLVEEFRKTDQDIRSLIAERNRARQEAAALRTAMDRRDTEALVRKPKQLAPTLVMEPTKEGAAK